MANAMHCMRRQGNKAQTTAQNAQIQPTRACAAVYLFVGDLGERGGELDKLLDRRRDAAHLVVGALDDDQQRRTLVGGQLGQQALDLGQAALGRRQQHLLERGAVHLNEADHLLRRNAVEILAFGLETLEQRVELCSVRMGYKQTQ
jgi:hypothetical protein